MILLVRRKEWWLYRRRRATGREPFTDVEDGAIAKAEWAIFNYNFYRRISS